MQNDSHPHNYATQKISDDSRVTQYAASATFATVDPQHQCWIKGFLSPPP
jgi:hypothetical protein